MSHSNVSGDNSGFKFGSAWFQKKINIRPVLRGCHLITDEILKQVPEIARFSIGLLHIESMLCIKHFYFILYKLTLRLH